ncbi:MAG: SBBP repeat-containing protein, partial [Dehalococcoidia bacterium]
NASGAASLLYATYLGGSGEDEAFGIAIDAGCSPCFASVTGYTTSSDLHTVAPLQSTYGGGTKDAFVARLNQSGSVFVYLTYLGGSGFDTGNSIAADSAGNLYVTGTTTSANLATAHAAQATPGGPAGTDNAFIAKLNPNAGSGGLIYFSYLGGSLVTVANHIAVDGSGTAYVIGSTSSTDFPTTNPLQSIGGPKDAFVAKLNTDGTLFLYATYLGGSGVDDGIGIALDPGCNTNCAVYAAGDTASTDFPDTAGFAQPANGGGTDDAFIAKLQPPLLGDVNGDGSVNAVDALCVLRIVAHMPSTGACPNPPITTADVNADKSVNAVDALCILRFVASLPGTVACPALR